MLTIRQIREQAQAPRSAVDAWYGGFVMRRFSAYLTWISLKLGLTPNQISLLSLSVAVIGSAWSVSSHSWLAWILGINLWYLLDHVDGEVARLRNMRTRTGFYFDTIINFIVQPLFCVAGQHLMEAHGISSPHLGWFLAYNLAMLSILPMTHEVILFQTKNEPTPGPVQPLLTAAAPANIFKKIFIAIHKTVLFPNLLLTVTLLAILGIFNHELCVKLTFVWFVWCAWASFLVWVSQLAHTVLTKKMDR